MLAAAVWTATACTTSSDPQVFEDFGVVRVVLVDPSLSQQSLRSGDGTQLAEWTLNEASLSLGGGRLDLLAGEPCTILDTALGSPSAAGACGGGLVLDTTPEAPQSVGLRVRFGMTLHRARPFVIPVIGDTDGDGVANDGNASGSVFDRPCDGPGTACDDNCPLVANASQLDTNRDGFGDACVVSTVFGALLDTDGDGAPDIADNCVFVGNPSQASSLPFNLIGTACADRPGRAHAGGNFEITLELGPQEIAIRRGLVTFLVVDLSGTRVTRCNWEFGVCNLDPGQVRFCSTHSLAAANAGCP